MKKKEKVGLSAVGFLGILSAALSFIAEATRIKESQVQITSTECIYPNSGSASGLALTAAMFLLVARVIIIVLTGCSCCKRNPNQSVANGTFAMACVVCSWFTFWIAQVIFLVGALIDSQRGTEFTAFGAYYYCNVVKRGQFAIAASLSLASVILGIAYSYTLFSTKKSGSSGQAPSNQIGITMGQPISPTRSQDSVFVHEDTYMRRQFT